MEIEEPSRFFFPHEVGEQLWFCLLEIDDDETVEHMTEARIDIEPDHLAAEIEILTKENWDRLLGDFDFCDQVGDFADVSKPIGELLVLFSQSGNALTFEGMPRLDQCREL